mgnify:CR=1 FL=1
MSIHKSLKLSGALGLRRNVFKRYERIKQLILDGKWDESNSPFKLPKQKIVYMKAKKKEKKEEAVAAASGTEAGAAPGTAAATPATTPGSKAAKHSASAAKPAEKK